MSTATVPATAPISSLSVPSTSANSIREVLLRFEGNPESVASWQAVVECRRAVAAEIASLAPAQKVGPRVAWALESIHLFSRSISSEIASNAEDLRLARDYHSRGWPGLLAAMALVAGWQWPEAPALHDVPTWLWAEYTEYLFNSPRLFTEPGQADTYRAFMVRRLEELLRLATANRGSAAIQAALASFARVGNLTPLLVGDSLLRRPVDVRGKLLTIAAGVRRDEPPFARSRAGRKLRVGIVCREFKPAAEICALLPTIEHLDPEKFEISIYVLGAVDSRLATSVGNRGAVVQQLAQEAVAALASLRGADLDVVLYGANLTGPFDPITELALHRIAPLQVAMVPNSGTTGLPEIDLFIADFSESSESPQDFTERLGLTRGPARVFAFEAEAVSGTVKWDRRSLGISPGHVLFVSTADYRLITPEIQRTWARVLAAVPDSRLLVHAFQAGDASESVKKQFSVRFDRVFSEAGVAGDRLLLCTDSLSELGEVNQLMAIGDIALDTFPMAAVDSVARALHAGVPAVAFEGQVLRSRSAATLLRSVGLSELVAGDEMTYVQVCVKLANPSYRAELKRRLADAIARLPAFLDPLAASDGLGGLLERAFDEIADFGAEAFRAQAEPIGREMLADTAALLASAQAEFLSGNETAAAQQAERALAFDPRSPLARQIMGVALLRSDRVERSVTYLMAAIQHAEGNAGLWHDLAIALRRAGHRRDALHALRTSIQLEPGRMDRQSMLNDWMAEGSAI